MTRRPPSSTLFPSPTLSRSPRHTLGARQVDELGRRLLPLRDDDARELELQQRLERATTRGGVQGREVGDLGFAEDMDAVRGEPLGVRSEEHTSELQSPCNLVCRLLLEKKKNQLP